MSLQLSFDVGDKGTVGEKKNNFVLCNAHKAKRKYNRVFSNSVNKSHHRKKRNYSNFSNV